MSKLKQTVFSYVIVFNPEDGSKKEAEIINSGLQLATSSKTLGMKLVRSLGKKWEKELDNIEIIVQQVQNTPTYSNSISSWGTLSYPGYAVTNNAGTITTANTDSTSVNTMIASSLKNN